MFHRRSPPITMRGCYVSFALLLLTVSLYLQKQFGFYFVSRVWCVNFLVQNSVPMVEIAQFSLCTLYAPSAWFDQRYRGFWTDHSFFVLASGFFLFFFKQSSVPRSRLAWNMRPGTFRFRGWSFECGGTLLNCCFNSHLIVPVKSLSRTASVHSTSSLAPWLSSNNSSRLTLGFVSVVCAVL